MNTETRQLCTLSLYHRLSPLPYIASVRPHHCRCSGPGSPHSWNNHRTWSDLGYQAQSLALDFTFVNVFHWPQRGLPLGLCLGLLPCACSWQLWIYPFEAELRDLENSVCWKITHAFDEAYLWGNVIVRRTRFWVWHLWCEINQFHFAAKETKYPSIERMKPEVEINSISFYWSMFCSSYKLREEPNRKSHSEVANGGNQTKLKYLPWIIFFVTFYFSKICLQLMFFLANFPEWLWLFFGGLIK